MPTFARILFFKDLKFNLNFHFTLRLNVLRAEMCHQKFNVNTLHLYVWGAGEKVTDVIEQMEVVDVEEEKEKEG